MHFYKINGSAGFGKTSAMIEQIKSLYDPNAKQQSFLVITPTNKAAAVLNSRMKSAGLPALANTLHSTIYTWRPTEHVARITRERVIDPGTMKFKVDENGEPVYVEKKEYIWEKVLSPAIADKTILVDESSMVTSDVWHDLIETGTAAAIYAYGDEKQLPPIEEYKDLLPHYKPYYQFWHNFDFEDSVKTLTVNYRQQGSLKDIVETVEQSVFGRFSNRQIPCPLLFGENFVAHITDMPDELIEQLISESDIVITPFNKVREMINIIARKLRAKKAGHTYSLVPVVGDKIIFTDSIKTVVNVGNYAFKKIVIAKNMTAVIEKIHDISLYDNIILMDFRDENGVLHQAITLSLKDVVGGINFNKLPQFRYAYGVTVHSSQGGQWERVLYLDGHWHNDNAAKLRYVAVTRASKTLSVLTGVSNKTEAHNAQNNPLVRIGLKYRAYDDVTPIVEKAKKRRIGGITAEPEVEPEVDTAEVNRILEKYLQAKKDKEDIAKGNRILEKYLQAKKDKEDTAAVKRAPAQFIINTNKI